MFGFLTRSNVKKLSVSVLTLLLLVSVQLSCCAQWSPPVGDPPPGDPQPAGPPPEHSIAWLKSLPDNTTLSESIIDKVVTRTFPEFGYFYVEELDGAMGIRVASVASPDPGDVITIASGTMKTYRGQRYLDNSSYTISEHNRATKPVGMTNKTMGGGDFLYEVGPPIVGQQGLWDGAGLNNIGKLIRVWGKVTEIIDYGNGTWYYYIDDGSGVDLAVDLEVAPNQGIPLAVNVGDQVAVTGISSCLTVDGYLIRVLRPVAPTVKIARAAGQGSPASKSPIKLTVTFSEPVTGFDQTDIVISGTAAPTGKTAVDTGDHKTFNVEISGMSKKGNVGVNISYGTSNSSYYGEKSLALPSLFIIDYSAYLPFRTINAREGVGGPGRHPKKPVMK
jgi:hypothetical protein